MDSLTTLNTFAATSVPYTDEAAGAATLTNRYQINGVIDTSLPVMENLEKICSASGSWLSYDVSTGKWGVVINRTGSSVASFNNSNILGPISVSGTGLKDLYNAVRVEFPNRDIRDASDFVKIELPAGDKNSNELPNTLNLAYDNINEPVQAQLLGFIELKQSRVDLIITFETDYSNINLQAGDLIDVTNTQFSFSAKIFRIITIAEKQGDSALTLEITALEYDTTVYSTADLSRFVRSDSTGIITIGSIGTPGTPVVTKFESDVRPRIVVTSTAPTGIVEAMEFWRTTDVLLAESARSYQQIGTQRPTGGGTYSSGTTVTFELDTLNSSNFFIKTRGINDLTVGQFSSPSGLVEYVPLQTTDAIDPNTSIKDALGAIATAQTLFTLLNLLDDLLAGITGKSIWDRIKDLFQEATGININTPGAVQSASAITVQQSGTVRTNQLTTLNFTGAGVTTSANAGAVTVTVGTVGGGSGGISVLNNPVENDYLVYNGAGFVAVPTCCTPVTWPTGWAPSYPGTSQSCVLTFGTKYPPDRNDLQDPLTNQQSDRAPTTGSYFIYVNAPAGRAFKNNIVQGSGTATLYESDGTVKSTLDASACIFTKDLIEFPFPTRDPSTDYYITLPAGFATYCNCPTPAITAGTLTGSWNFNTPPATVVPEITNYNPTANNFTAPTADVPALAQIQPNGNSVCPNAKLRILFDETVVKGSGTVSIKRVSDDFEVDPKSVSSATTTVVYDNISSFTTTSSIGTGATFTITSNPAVYPSPGSTVTEAYYTATVVLTGDDYVKGDTITISGAQLGGTSPANNCVLTVLDVKGDEASEGQINTISASGTPAGKTIDFGTINNLVAGVQYYVTIPAGAVNKNTLDCNERTACAALTKNAGSYFTVKPTLAFLAKVVSFAPLVNGTDQKINIQSNIGIQFNDSITFHTSGTVRLYNAANTLLQTFDVAQTFANAQVSELMYISGDTLFVNPTVDMAADTTHYVLIDAGVIKDSCGTVYGGLSDNTLVRFKTDGGPTAVSVPFNASGSVNQTGVVMDFDRTIEPSTGLVRIIDVNTSATIATVASTDPSVSITEI